MTKTKKVYHIEYKQDHKLAKFIVACVVSVLLVLAELNTGSLGVVLSVVAVWVWIWGVNAFQYVIEHIRHHTHKVDKI